MKGGKSEREREEREREREREREKREREREREQSIWEHFFSFYLFIIAQNRLCFYILADHKSCFFNTEHLYNRPLPNLPSFCEIVLYFSPKIRPNCSMVRPGRFLEAEHLYNIAAPSSMTPNVDLLTGRLVCHKTTGSYPFMLISEHLS